MILSTLFFILLFIVGTGLFLITIPYNYFFQYSYKDNLSYKIAVRTIVFSLVLEKTKNYEVKYFKIFGIKKNIAEKKDKKGKKKSKTDSSIPNQIKEKIKKETKKRDFNFLIKVISSEDIFHVINFLKDILKMLKPKNFKLNFLLGLDDPYQNGLVLAYYNTLKGIYPKFPVNININWQAEVYEAEGEIAGYILPRQLLLRLLFFIFSAQTIKTGWEIIKYKRNQKKQKIKRKRGVHNERYRKDSGNNV